MGRRPDERGAVALTVAFVMTALVGVASFAIDLGMQRVGIRDMQALSDVVALDLARELGGRTTAAIEADPAWEEAKDESVARNDDTLGGTPAVVAVLGSTKTQVFEPTGPDETPDAVQVTSTSSVEYVLRGGEGAVVRSAVARAKPFACIRLGSFAVGLNSSKSALLNALIGDALNLGVLGYTGLATADVSLLGISTELGVGTVDELLALDSLKIGDFYLAVARVLQNQGDTVNAQLLQTIALQVTSLPTIDLGELLSVGEGGNSALAAQLNVLDLVAGAAFLSNGTNFLSLPGTTLTIPGLTSTTIRLSVIEVPQQGCTGGPDAHTAQITLEVTGKMLNVDLGVATADADVQFDLQLAQATGRITNVECGASTPADPSVIDVDVASSLTKLQLAPVIKVKTKPVLLVPGIDILRLRPQVGTVPPGTTGQPHIEITGPASYLTPVSAGSGVALSPLAINMGDPELLGVLTLPLGSILTPVTNLILNPLISGLNSQLLTPLTDLLGINLAGADVFPVEPYPTCDNPSLVE